MNRELHFNRNPIYPIGTNNEILAVSPESCQLHVEMMTANNDDKVNFGVSSNFYMINQ